VIRIFVVVLAALIIVGLPSAAGAKGDVVRIVIEGQTLAKPLVISDPGIVKRFFIWFGPGAGQPLGSEASLQPGSVLDWHQGVVAQRPKGMRSYDVSFYCTYDRSKPDQLTYVVKYEYDPAAQRGYVHLPGQGEKNFGLNVSTVFHGVEGNWFYSSAEWETWVRPVVDRATRQDDGALAARR